LDATITAVDDVGEGMQYVTVELSKPNANSLESFMKLFQLKQQNVTEFLKRAKGLS
jgi:hypothetical protein